MTAQESLTYFFTYPTKDGMTALNVALENDVPEFRKTLYDMLTTNLQVCYKKSQNH
jgi:hypothetical protein